MEALTETKFGENFANALKGYFKLGGKWILKKLVMAGTAGGLLLYMMKDKPGSDKPPAGDLNTHPKNSSQDVHLKINLIHKQWHLNN